MGVVPRITCRRCKRQYSGMLKKCPYCGTRRENSSTRTPASTESARPGTNANTSAANNSRWRMIFSVILIVAVIAAVIMLINISIRENSEPEPTPTPLETPSPTPKPTPKPTPTPTPTPTITSITIAYNGNALEGFACNPGENTQLQATAYPIETVATVTWSSSDESICTVTQDGLVTGVASGWAKLYASCGAVTAECDVWVR